MSGPIQILEMVNRSYMLCVWCCPLRLVMQSLQSDPMVHCTRQLHQLDVLPPVLSSPVYCFHSRPKEKAITVDTLVASKRIEREQWFTFCGCCLWGKREVYSSDASGDVFGGGERSWRWHWNIILCSRRWGGRWKVPLQGAADLSNGWSCYFLVPSLPSPDKYLEDHISLGRTLNVISSFCHVSRFHLFIVQCFRELWLAVIALISGKDSIIFLPLGAPLHPCKAVFHCFLHLHDLFSFLCRLAVRGKDCWNGFPFFYDCLTLQWWTSPGHFPVGSWWLTCFVASPQSGYMTADVLDITVSEHDNNSTGTWNSKVCISQMTSHLEKLSYDQSMTTECNINRTW